MDNSETQDIVDTVATENTDAASQEHDEQGQGQQPEQEQQTQEQEEAQKAEQEQQKKSRAQERIEKLARENAELRRWRAEQEAKAQQPQQSSERPNIIDFEDVNDYYKALDEYQISQAEKRVFERLQQETQSKAQIEQQVEFQNAVEELTAEGVDVSAYEQKALTLPPLPVQLNQFGLPQKDTLLLAKQLLDDTDTYLEIASMNPVQAAVKIGQIINQKPQAPKQSKAPKPINPVSANAPATRSPEQMSDDEWYRAETQKRKGK